MLGVTRRHCQAEMVTGTQGTPPGRGIHRGWVSSRCLPGAGEAEPADAGGSRGGFTGLRMQLQQDSEAIPDLWQQAWLSKEHREKAQSFLSPWVNPFGWVDVREPRDMPPFPREWSSSTGHSSRITLLTQGTTGSGVSGLRGLIPAPEVVGQEGNGWGEKGSTLGRPAVGDVPSKHCESPAGAGGGGDTGGLEAAISQCPGALCSPSGLLLLCRVLGTTHGAVPWSPSVTEMGCPAVPSYPGAQHPFRPPAAPAYKL